LFPLASVEFLPYVCGLAVIGIIYGALVAMMQEDLKKLVAYSSVSHLGFVMLGIFAFNHYGLQGALLQNINHGITSGALFLLVGMIYDRRHTRLIKEFGGLAKVIPVFTVCFMIMTLSSVGLPGTNGFIGEFLILLGIFQNQMAFAIMATTGVIFAACYMLWMFQRVMFLKITNPENEKLTDMTPRELCTMIPLIIFVFWIGFYPSPFTKTFDASIEHLITQVKPNNDHAPQDHHASAKPDTKIAQAETGAHGTH
ncbi:MAG: NADH-quinone oxidoreductase subunit M, partial [Nitrospinota bacterium]|nr:NADH-quinone oxidoreductase subunit M [Nitrospinota bacterium]